MAEQNWDAPSTQVARDHALLEDVQVRLTAWGWAADLKGQMKAAFAWAEAVTGYLASVGRQQ